MEVVGEVALMDVAIFLQFSLLGPAPCLISKLLFAGYEGISAHCQLCCLNDSEMSRLDPCLLPGRGWRLQSVEMQGWSQCLLALALLLGVDIGGEGFSAVSLSYPTFRILLKREH